MLGMRVGYLVGSLDVGHDGSESRERIEWLGIVREWGCTRVEEEAGGSRPWNECCQCGTRNGPIWRGERKRISDVLMLPHK